MAGSGSVNGGRGAQQSQWQQGSLQEQFLSQVVKYRQKLAKYMGKDQGRIGSLPVNGAGKNFLQQAALIIDAKLDAMEKAAKSDGAAYSKYFKEIGALKEDLDFVSELAKKGYNATQAVGDQWVFNPQNLDLSLTPADKLVNHLKIRYPELRNVPYDLGVTPNPAPRAEGGRSPQAELQAPDAKGVKASANDPSADALARLAKKGSAGGQAGGVSAQPLASVRGGAMPEVNGDIREGGKGAKAEGRGEFRAREALVKGVEAGDVVEAVGLGTRILRALRLVR